MSDREWANGRFMLGDCLDRMRELPDDSVDMILCDLPYGTTACSWDSIIPFEPLWAEYWRVSKAATAVVLTASQPFTSVLTSSNMRDFRYAWVWEKTSATNFALIKKQPAKKHEDVAVFYRKQPTYNPQMEEGKPYVDRRSGGGRNVAPGAKDLARQPIDNAGTRYPSSVQKISNANHGTFHPTQKPVALFEYLIRTYTDEGMTVLDNCAGSGTTAIAAERTGRRWVCIERDPEYFAKACERVDAEIKSKGLFA